MLVNINVCQFIVYTNQESNETFTNKKLNLREPVFKVLAFWNPGTWSPGVWDLDFEVVL